MDNRVLEISAIKFIGLLHAQICRLQSLIIFYNKILYTFY